jgi:hypothetical protein
MDEEFFLNLKLNRLIKLVGFCSSELLWPPLPLVSDFDLEPLSDELGDLAVCDERLDA